MSDTPRTDAQACHVSVDRAGCITLWYSKDGGYVPRLLSERLERENAALRQQLEDVQRVRDSIEGALADAYDEAEACWVNKARLADAAEEVLDSYILTKRVLTGHPCPQNMGICIDLRAAIDAARAKEGQP